MNAISKVERGRWPGESQQRWVTEPRRHAPGLDNLLAWSSQQGASRISFHTGNPYGCVSMVVTTTPPSMRSTRARSRLPSTTSTAQTGWHAE